MESYAFIDALTGDEVTLDYLTGDASLRRGVGDAAPCASIFFPGCSLINYAAPLVGAVNDLLSQSAAVDGISLLCCGRILSYEPNGEALRSHFEQQLCDRLAESGIERIVAACPNCLTALRDLLARDERVAHIEVAALPLVLAELGYRIDGDTASALVLGEGGQDARGPLVLCAKDSCPDRDLGEFARGMRELMPEGMCVDPAHNRERSLCCGSLLNAAGKFEAGLKVAHRCGAEALEKGADALVAPCISCTMQLNFAQVGLPALHYLELLFNWRIDWARVGGVMKLRFLFDETLGATEVASSGRAFAGLGAKE